MIAITGATGQLGRLVIHALLDRVKAPDLVALARDPDKAKDLAAKGVAVRQADYSRPETLTGALAGVDRLLLVSGSEVGKRVAQHQAVIDAAKAAGVKFIAYTSILRADSSILSLAIEHRETEAALKASGIPYSVLRNGWYNENYTAGIPVAVEHGAVLGSAGNGKISSAARADYALAASVVMTSDGHAGKIYELAGDHAYTLGDLARQIATQSGKAVVYKDMPEPDYKKALLDFGLPPEFAEILANSSTGTAKGALFDDSRTLSTLIGRPTTPMADSVSAALNK